ncbi:multiple coagulation factor deficiency protein 2 homolog [Homarus americanus]|uniref:Multiple coagulation factor deficiency protein 2-like 1 n=1 Tax=Homarus americanus TaxID=6706 RepID=A0A8J5NG73_HOMAM|nr:multiple coagulation factor deficiency protein 2 homolog [Homarus americanus]KAG7178078.1 Multiple coagulation factor deficiency protein 2-like 1 [Homarus americanus]
MKVLALWVVLAVWATCVLTTSAIEGSHPPMHRRTNEHSHQHQKQNKHRHHVPKKPPAQLSNPKLLEDNQLLHDREHLKEELPEYLSLDRIEQMSDKELDYHYFKIHDFDNNFGLDGMELMAAINHIDDDDDDDVGIDEEKLKNLSKDERKIIENFRQEKWNEKLKFYVELIDDVLKENDNNNDGYISWGEFRLAQTRRKHS